MKKGIVVLTGAGISAESGLKTFRAADGLWEEERIEDVATPEGFARNPARVLDFYNQRRRKLVTVAPNAAHLALAEFESQNGQDFLLITQNIDDLHERAGSGDVVHMHGELLKMKCLHCGGSFTVVNDMHPTDPCKNCAVRGRLRPDIVWFGEMPLHMERIQAALATCRLLVSIGTSGHVYPAAGFAREAQMAGAECVELNLEKSAVADCFTRAHYGPATQIVPEFFRRLKRENN